MNDRDDLPVEGTEPPDPLVDRLRSLTSRVDPVPDHLQHGAEMLFAWRTIDRDLAELPVTSVDSLDSDREPAGIRAQGTERALRYGWRGDIEMELQVVEAPHGARRLVGQVSPPARADIVVVHGEATTRGAADELGAFDIGGLPAAWANVLWSFSDATERTYRTGWILL